MPAAYLTGGASGLGKATAEMLVKNGIKVFIADVNESGAEAVANDLNKDKQGMAQAAKLDVTDWNSQAKVFGQALHAFERIDYVYPIAGIGERRWLDNDPSKTTGFEPPDLTVMDIDLKGFLYTVSLAIQQFRRQDKDENGFRGKSKLSFHRKLVTLTVQVATVASVCGFYTCPTLPIYTAAKHAIVGLTRSYGKYLPEESITFNSICPNVVRTNISTAAFYDQLEEKGLLTPIEGVIETFESLLGKNDQSGECFEIGPHYKTQGAILTHGPPYLDDESAATFELLYHRGRPLHLPK